MPENTDKNEDLQKKLESQEKEIKKLKKDLKKATSPRSFFKVFCGAMKMSVRDAFDREHKIESQKELIKELRQQLREAEGKQEEEEKAKEEYGRGNPFEIQKGVDMEKHIDNMDGEKTPENEPENEPENKPQKTSPLPGDVFCRCFSAQIQHLKLL